MTVVNPGMLPGNDPSEIYGHDFLLYKGRYYDAESPEGVDDWRQLGPFQKRTRKNVVKEAQDPDDPETLAARYLKAMVSEKDAADAAKAAEVLNTFKRQAIGYIKWAHAGDEQGIGYDPADLKKIRQAKTFEEAAAALARYETEPSFMLTVVQGYF